MRTSKKDEAEELAMRVLDLSCRLNAPISVVLGEMESRLLEIETAPHRERIERIRRRIQNQGRLVREILFRALDRAPAKRRRKKR